MTLEPPTRVVVIPLKHVDSLLFPDESAMTYKKEHKLKIKTYKNEYNEGYQC